MTNAIEAAIAQATANAANMVAAGAVPAAAAAAVPAAYSAPATPAAPLTIDDMLSGSLDVNAWLKVNEFGLFIGADKTPFQTIRVKLDLSSVMYCYSIRYGNPAQYAKTYDHVTDVKGRPWVEVVRQAQQIDSKASEFRSADVPFICLDELKGRDGKTLAAEGDVLGTSISVTGWKPFQTFLKDLQRAGFNIHSDSVELELGYITRKNDKGEWGILTYNNPQHASE